MQWNSFYFPETQAAPNSALWNIYLLCSQQQKLSVQLDPRTPQWLVFRLFREELGPSNYLILLLFSCSVVSDFCDPLGLWPTRLLCPRDFPGKNTGVSCQSLLQGIFLTQGSNLCLLHWQADSLPLSHQASPYFRLHFYFLIWDDFVQILSFM